MNERPCIRCQLPVLLEDGHLVYCSHCGGPQIFLSEELQAELSETTRAYNERQDPPALQAAGDTAVPEGTGARWNPLRRARPNPGQGPVDPWTLGVHYALLSACIALSLGLLSLLLPPVGLLMLLWVVSAPMLTVAFFNGQAGTASPADAGFAARLGLLTGLLVACCCALVFTLSLVLTRFVFHNATLLDAQLAASFAQQRTLVLARLGAEARPTLDLFTVPEYRVGILLSVTATSACLYLLLSAVAGGVAGVLLRRRGA